MNNLPGINDGAFLINLNGKNSKETHLLFIDRNTIVYFQSFGTEYILQEEFNKIKDQSITHNISRIRDVEFITC